MNYYFAPMEGLTDSIYRRLHHKYFGGVDVYFMPFFSPTEHRSLTPREARELPKADSVAFRAVPQVMTKNAEDFLWAANVCRDLGYTEINLNAGCPSGTVVAKGKGAGLLKDIDALDALLGEIFRRSTLPVSVKTRLGMESPEEFERILAVYNRYPIKELTVHPRVRSAFYKGSVDTGRFDYAVKESRNPLCYNGNVTTVEALKAVEEKYPVQSVMIGRRLIGDPGFLTPEGTNTQALQEFFDELLECYTESFGSARNAMFRLKENWQYLLPHFENAEKLGKRLKKATDVREYKAVTHEIFAALPMKKDWHPEW